jgi:hypothetical protein
MPAFAGMTLKCIEPASCHLRTLSSSHLCHPCESRGPVFPTALSAIAGRNKVICHFPKSDIILHDIFIHMDSTHDTNDTGTSSQGSWANNQLP